MDTETRTAPDPRPFERSSTDYLSTLLRDVAAELHHRKALDSAMQHIARTDAQLIEDLHDATLWVDAP